MRDVIHTANQDAMTDRYRHLIEHIQDAVVEFELDGDEPLVVDANTAFVDVFGYELDEIRGESLNDFIVPEWLQTEARELDSRTGSGEVNYRQVRRETTTGLRDFLYRGVPYEDSETRPGGFAVYTDLTDVSRNERSLQVMNRILRHNLRNKANIITAYTTRLLAAADTHDPEQTDIAARVERAAHDLETLASEADDVRAILTHAGPGESTVDCVPLVQKVVTDARRSAPAATIETDLPASMELRATARLAVAIESLVENAIEHNPNGTPRVRVRVTADDSPGWASIYVDDDGPCIPESERAVITGDADITPTRHGTGLGLWLVTWTAQLFGGELSFEKSDLGGNSVRLRLLRADD